MKNLGMAHGLKTYACKTVIVGTGAAGLKAAETLARLEADDFILVTEGVMCGTSRNTGSDKQTYYKLSLSGRDPDSVRAMAEDYFNGRCVDGDIALVEASLSVPSFMRLVSLGVPFPKNRYGEYVGYKTDHDPYRRATSAGPYTSRFMTDCLWRSVQEHGVEVLDGMQMVRILVKDGSVRGIIVIERASGELSLILCHSLVMATGGPAGIYEMSVYPESQFGASGLAFEAGCMGRNLTEWQYGLASLSPRWNVSGSYMQVLPRFVSVDAQGLEHEFLSEYALTRPEMLSRVFLKGYQWPFDVRKLDHGSSIVDVLCLLEMEKGRRVYLDYMHNPDFKDIPWAELSNEARGYLESAGALGSTPLERLRVLNLPAYEFYLDKGVDLGREYLEIGLCAQHNNGGLAMDSWWRSNIDGIFPVGECAGSHGVYRPGGSALNAGQCGATRAAEWIAAHRSGSWEPDKDGIDDQISCVVDLAEGALHGTMELDRAYASARHRMSLCGAAIRNDEAIRRTLAEVEDDLSHISDVKVSEYGRIWELFELRNALVTQRMYLAAMSDFISKSGASRGSALYTAERGPIHPEGLDDRFSYFLEDETQESVIQECLMKPDGEISFSYRTPRPVPDEDDFFENVWTRFRKDGCVF